MILLDPLARPVIGHRGNRAHSPENTIASLLEAVDLGVDAVEFDVRITLDGVAVLMHDDTLERTTNGHGPVASFRHSELAELDAGARFSGDHSNRPANWPWRGKGVRIPTLDDVFDALPTTLPLIIELKTPEAASIVQKSIAKHDAAHRVVVAGFDAPSTRNLRGAGFALGACQKEIASLIVPALLRMTVSKPPFQAMCIPSSHWQIPLPLRSLIRAMQPHHVTTHIWTVNDPLHARSLWDLGVNGIITDDPRIILDARGG